MHTKKAGGTIGEIRRASKRREGGMGRVEWSEYNQIIMRGI